MREPQRVLQVLTIMNQGGAETMIMNYFRAIDRSKVQFDFLVHRQERGVYDDEIERMGGRIYRAMPVRPWTYFSYFSWLDKFFKEHHGFVAVHSHIQENSGFVFKYAQKYGIYNCIAHSHIASLGMDYKYLFRQFGKWWVKKYATRNMSCGEEAGVFLYDNRRFEVLHNAIAADNFKYDFSIRQDVVDELNLSGKKLIIGSVARFGYQKNHTFMIDIMAELVKLVPESVLLLVGGGEEEPKIKEKVALTGLSEHVLFLGLRRDVERVMQAFDIFLMPSLFEGLPVSIIEAQASGLKCLLSDTIDQKVDITGNIEFLSLNESPKKWSEKLVSMANYQRTDTSSIIRKSGYDVHSNLYTLYNIYVGEQIEEQTPLITVAIPVYNATAYVDDAIQSVLNQSFQNFELIITNDGSTDDSISKVRHYNDPRIIICDDVIHKGLSERLNEQVAMAKGVYFARMDADDVMMPERLSETLSFLRSHPEAHLVGSCATVINELGTVIGHRGRSNEKPFSRVKALLHPTIMGKTEWFRNNVYHSECDGCEDFDLWLRSNNDYMLYQLAQPLLLYRDHRQRSIEGYWNLRKVERRVIRKNGMKMGRFWTAIHLLVSYCSTLIVTLMIALRCDRILQLVRNNRF